MTFQPLPEVTGDTEAFWRGGSEGLLNVHRCRRCRVWFHPPTPVCPECLSIDVGAEATSGRATVESFSLNVQPWSPDMKVPFLIAVVSIDDAPGVHLTTRLVDIEPDAVSIGMPVEVVFERVADDVYLPLFGPVKS